MKGKALEENGLKEGLVSHPGGLRSWLLLDLSTQHVSETYTGIKRIKCM